MRFRNLRITHARWAELAPLVIPLSLLPWLCAYAPRYVAQPLFRDPGNFQLLAWCLRHGQLLYEDVATPNGPLPSLIHLLIQLVAGESERAFRTADLTLNVLGAGTLGALLAPARSVVSRAVWAAVGMALWLSYIFSMPWAETVQREIYYALIGTLGLALVYAEGYPTTRRGRVALGLGGFCTSIILFGKHSGIVYPAVALLALLVADEPERGTRRQRIVWFASGVVVAVGVMLTVIAVWATFSGFWYWYFVYPFRVYRFMQPQLWQETLSALNPERSFAALSVSVTLAGAFAITFGLLPRSAIALVIVPMLQLFAGVAQRKGFNYQFQPALAGATVMLLVAFSRAWQLGIGEKNKLLAWAAAALTSWYAIDTLAESPWRRDQAAHRDPEIVLRRKVADFLRARTAEDAKVFYYGIDPYTLYFAERRPADPRIVSFEANFAWALTGHPSAGGPNREQREVIEALQEQTAQQLCTRLGVVRPQAMVLEPTPGVTGPDAVEDVVRLCPNLREELAQRYELAQTFGRLRIYLRRG